MPSNESRGDEKTNSNYRFCWRRIFRRYFTVLCSLWVIIPTWMGQGVLNTIGLVVCLHFKFVKINQQLLWWCDDTYSILPQSLIESFVLCSIENCCSRFCRNRNDPWNDVETGWLCEHHINIIDNFSNYDPFNIGRKSVGNSSFSRSLHNGSFKNRNTVVTTRANNWNRSTNQQS